VPIQQPDIEAVFHTARQKPQEERAAYLDQACGDDPDLRKRIERLLGAHLQIGSFLESPAAEFDATRELPVSETPGAMVGQYKLLEEIGEGGFGVVFLAEQQQPVRRKVALKVLKPGMDTRRVVARFEAERQALAIMDHPNIARVFDGGETPAGRPYFVMELVKGVPITDFCDQNHLTPRQRLELFLPVCQAIQHAHLKGVIHRDLKPSNVLVSRHDTTPVVKVIDFGVAKAVGQELTSKTLFTGAAQMVGTPLYMSPEQAGMSDLDVDTRSDIYSLGVLLYELLTGTTPHSKERFQAAGYDEIRRIIRDEEPPKPSTRLSTLGQAATTVSANCGTELRRLSILIRGELDWIVMKALEKDRNRRYETASALAQDVQRYLSDEPVLACPPSVGYRFRKFARRHRPALATAAVVLLALLATLGALGVAVRTLAVSTASTQEALGREQKARDDQANTLEREQQTQYLQRIALAARERPDGNLGLAERLLDECPEGRRGWEWHFLKRRRYEQPRELTPPAVVTRVAFSPDGRHLVAGCMGGTVLVWDTRTWEPVRPGIQCGGDIYALAFSHDGRHFATGGSDRKVRVWELGSDKPVHTFKGHTLHVNQLAFSPDGGLLASAGEDATVRLWDLKADQAGRVFSEHSCPVQGLAFDPQGPAVISAGEDGIVKVWDPATGVVTATTRVGIRWVSTMAFHPGSRQLALASRDGTLELRDGPSGTDARILEGHTDLITNLAFSPDGQRLASASDEKVLKVWDTATGREAIDLPIEPSTAVSVAFSPNGHYLATGRPGKGVRLWNGTPLTGDEQDGTAQTLKRHTDTVVRLAFSRDSRRLVTASHDGTARVWDPATGREVRIFSEHTAKVSAVAFSPDGEHVASGSWDETVRVWNAETGQVTHKLPSQAGPIWDVAFSPDGQRLAAGNADGSVTIWDLAAGTAFRFPAHKREVAGLAFSPNGKLLATTGGRDHSTKLLDAATGKEIGPLRSGTSETRIWSVAFHPEGHELATATGFGRVSIWDVGRRKELKVMPDADTTRIHRVAYHPGGRVLATAGWDQTVRLWDATTGNAMTREPLLTLKGHAGSVWDVAFSWDGQFFASCGGRKGKGEVRIWADDAWKPATAAAGR